MRTNQRLAQLWLDALATELGASAGTLATYTDDLTCYLAWLDEHSLGLDEVRSTPISTPPASTTWFETSTR
jgi:integrase/recombinase XerD